MTKCQLEDFDNYGPISMTRLSRWLVFATLVLIVALVCATKWSRLLGGASGRDASKPILWANQVRMHSRIWQVGDLSFTAPVEWAMAERATETVSVERLLLQKDVSASGDDHNKDVCQLRIERGDGDARLGSGVESEHFDTGYVIIWPIIDVATPADLAESRELGCAVGELVRLVKWWVDTPSKDRWTVEMRGPLSVLDSVACSSLVSQLQYSCMERRSR